MDGRRLRLPAYRQQAQADGAHELAEGDCRWHIGGSLNGSGARNVLRRLVEGYRWKEAVPELWFG